MAKKDTTPSHDYEAIGRAVVLIASLFGTTAVAAPAPAAPTPTTSTEPSKSEDKPAPAATTPAPPKGDEATPEKGEDVISLEDFVKQALTLVKVKKDNGAALKALWADLKQADGSPVNLLSEIQPSDREAFLEAVEEAKLA